MTTEPGAFRPNSQFLRSMIERGHVHQCTDFAALDAAASNGIVTGYVGYDLTASSLHVGNMATIMLLRRLQKAGGKPIVLLGGDWAKSNDTPNSKTSPFVSRAKSAKVLLECFSRKWAII